MSINFTGRLAGPNESFSSNDIGVNIAEEATPGRLDGTAGNRYFYGLELNSFSEFGGEVETIRRRFFEARRQLGKARVSKVTAQAGWQADITDDQFGRVARAFLFADDGTEANKPTGAKASTQSIYNHKKVDVTVTNATTITFTNTIAALGTPAFKVRDLVLVTDRNGGSNNGKVFLASNATNSAITVAGATAQVVAAGASPNVCAMRLDNVGYEFDTAHVTLEFRAGGLPSLKKATAAPNLTTLGLSVGETIFIGGDTAASRFTDGSNVVNGFARIQSITDDEIFFDDTTFPRQTTTKTVSGAQKKIRIFYGNFLTNGNTRRTFTVERVLGRFSHSGVLERKRDYAADYVIGAMPNEWTINYEDQAIVNTDYTFVPLGSATINYGRNADGTAKSGSPTPICSEEDDVWRVPQTGLGGYSTNNDVFRVKLQLQNEASDLFSFVTSATMGITNGVTGTSALGYRSYIAQNVGSFEGTGTVEALFEDVAALEAVQNNLPAYFNIINVAKDSREGLVLDFPEVTLAGQPSVELDTNILLPLDMAASQGRHGYTASVCLYSYVPKYADEL